MNVDEVRSMALPDVQQHYDERDAILYALGIGFGSEPLDPAHLRYLYESQLLVVPTYANVLGYSGQWTRDERYGLDWKRMLHAEQRLTLHRPLPARGRMVGRHALLGVRDMGSRGAMLHMSREVTDLESREVVATVIQTVMLRGDGGCGDWGDAPAPLEPLPEGPVDAILAMTVLEIQPLIYRLSGDLNPLHVDPAVAQAAGFARPILHGLASKGMAGYALLRTFGNLDPSSLRAMAVRFTSPVFPTDHIRFEFWRSGSTAVRFRALAMNRENAIVLDRGLADMVPASAAMSP